MCSGLPSTNNYLVITMVLPSVKSPFIAVVEVNLHPKKFLPVQTFRSQLSSGEEGAVTGKHEPYKKARSAPPLLKRKPQSGLYASVRSSGYGKPSSPFKTLSALEKKTSKDIMKSKTLRSIPTSNQARKKGNHMQFSCYSSVHIVYYVPYSLLFLFLSLLL